MARELTTIDAFCLGLLREFPLEAGLDPDVALIDEVDSDRLLSESIEDVLGEARRGSDVDMRFLIARFSEGPSDGECASFSPAVCSKPSFWSGT